MDDNLVLEYCGWSESSRERNHHKIKVLEAENSTLIDQLAYQRSEFKSINLEFTTMKNSNISLQEKIKSLEADRVEFEELKVKLGRTIELEKENESFRLKISELEKILEKKVLESEKLVKQVKSIQDDLDTSESNCIDHLKKTKDLEKRNIKLAKQLSDFEQIVIVERRRFAKERE